MNHDGWSVLWTTIRSWFGTGAANKATREPTSREGVRRPLHIEAASANSRFRKGRRYYVDPPAAVQPAAAANQAARGGRRSTNRGRGGVDFKRSPSPRGDAARWVRTNRLVSLFQRFLAVRNGRRGQRLAGSQSRLARATRTHSQHPAGRGFTESCAGGEPANAEPP